MNFQQNSEIQQLIQRLNDGDETARDEIIAAAGNRLLNLTSAIKRGFNQVNRWEQTEDVFQRSAMRLHRALGEVKINDARHFYRLAATQIRRELIDLARHYGGPEGMGANHATQLAGDAEQTGVPPHGAYDAADQDAETPVQLFQWSELHEAIGALPDDQREAVELLFYNGLSQEEAAAVTGVSSRTIKRHWRAARLALFEKFGGQLPGMD